MSEFKKIIKKLIIKQALLMPMLLVISAYSLIQPLLYKKIIDDGLKAQNFDFFYKMVIIYFAYYLSLNIIQYFQNLIIIKISNKNYKFLNKILFSKLFKIYGNNNHNLGEIQSLLNNDINKILNFSTATFAKIISNTIIAIVVYIYILNQSTLLAIICFGLLVTAIIVNRYFFALKKKLGKLLRLTWKSRMEHIALVHNSLNFIKANLKKNFFWLKYEAIINQTNTITIKHFNAEFSNQKTNNIILFTCEIITFIIIGKNVIEGSTTIGSLLSLMAFIPKFFNPAISAINSATNIGLFIENFNKLNSFYSLKEEEAKINENTILSISINNFSFSYQNTDKKLNYSSNKISLGKINVIKGANGCGKSTLLKFILKLIKPPKNSIKINNNSIQQISSKSIRKQVLYLPQDSVIFVGTVAENILIDKKISNKKLILTLEKSNLLRHVNNMGGINRNLKSSEDLSGGEKQIINLCRILVHKKNIVILDEPTASLHNDVSLLSLELIKKLNKNHKTTFIIITHTTFAKNNSDFEIINL